MALALALAAAQPGCTSGEDEPDDTPGAAAVQTARPSPCAGLADPLERYVCEDADLRAMDTDASRLYQRLLARADHTTKGALRAEHGEWRRGLAECMEASAQRRRDCLDERYNAWLVGLDRRLRNLQ